MPQKSLSPKAIEYFELLLNASSSFKEDVAKIREKNGIELTDKFLASKEYKTLKASHEVKHPLGQDGWIKNNCFYLDVMGLCCNYFIDWQVYYEDVKSYVLTGIFPPLAWLTSIKADKEAITIKTHYGITRKEFEQVWDTLASLKESRALGREPARKRAKTHSYFDLKLALYRQKIDPSYKPNKQEKQALANIEKTTKSKWLKEVEEWKKELDFKIVL